MPFCINRQDASAYETGFEKTVANQANPIPLAAMWQSAKGT